MKHKLNMKII